MQPISNLDILVLALLAETPMHGYEIIRRISDRNFYHWVETPTSSVYHSLRKLASGGFLKTKEIRLGKSPPRTVYELTKKGREAVEEGTLNLLRAPTRFLEELHIGLFGSGILSEEQLLSALEEQKTSTKLLADEIEKSLSDKKTKSDYRLRLIYERLLSLYKAHSRWLKDAVYLIKKHK
ncbi:hypothetical protein DRQ36_04245 [bacterium]|nr:MAG: hypothetical protein DRQ36_04245 [bacterium]